MNNCALCSIELKFINTPTFNSGKLSDGVEVCSSCFKKINNIDSSVAFYLKKHSLTDIQKLLEGYALTKHLKPPQVDKGKIFATIVTVGIMLWLFFSIKGCFSDSTETEQTISSKKLHSTADALVASQFFVEERLKSPSSAEFDYNARNTVQINDTIFQVSSFVDSQNSFGAMLRMDYSCTIIFSNDSILCRELVMKER